MFSQNWFETLAKNNFENYIKPEFKNKTINVLEIGCFEGNCSLYMFENILDDNSTLTVIDPFDDTHTHGGYRNIYETYTNNLNKYIDRINIINGFSNKELYKLKKKSFDFIYIDGDHTSLAALADAIMAWPLLKSGGIMSFDDYMWTGGNPDLNHIFNPHSGINYFLKSYEGQYELIVKNWQVIIKKKKKKKL